MPSDDEHDAFWKEMLADVHGFDPSTDVFQITDEIPLTAFSDYKSAIWVATAAYNATTGSFINQVIRFIDPSAPATTGKSTPNIVALFMSAGGHVLLVGEQIYARRSTARSFQPTSPVFPLIFRYELARDQDGDYEESDVGVRGTGEDSFRIPGLLRERPRYRVHLEPPEHPQGERRARVSGEHDPARSAVAAGTTGSAWRSRWTRSTSFRRSTSVPRWAARDAGSPRTSTGLNTDIYNPAYFADVPMVVRTGVCNSVAELVPAAGLLQADLRKRLLQGRE